MFALRVLSLLTATWLAGPIAAGLSRQFQLSLSGQVYQDAQRLQTETAISLVVCALLCTFEPRCYGVERYSSGDCTLLGAVPANSQTAAASGVTTYLSRCPPGWFLVPGACFLYVNSDNAIWSEVPARCAALWPGASIAALRTEEQLAVIREELSEAPNGFSIGTQRGEDNTWRLLDGSEATVLPWAGGQPGASEMCTGLYPPDITLHDTSCTSMAYLCGLEI